MKCPLCDRPRKGKKEVLCEGHWSEFIAKAKGDFWEFQAFNNRVKDALLVSDSLE